MKRVVMFSGGVGSWATAWRVKERMPEGDELVLLFADTRMEDSSLYSFLSAASLDLKTDITFVVEGRTPWEVFRDVKFIGNSRIDPCSRILKREPLRKWLNENCAPEDTVVYLGIDWTEINRMEKAAKYWEPWRVEAPLTKAPFLTKQQMLAMLDERGILRPKLYDMGFPHNNCGGFCVKAGHRWFLNLLEKMPKRYARHEHEEEKTQKALGKPVTVLRDRRGGTTTPLSLREFRLRATGGAGEQIDMYDWGGCNCFSPDDYSEDEARAEVERLKNA